MIDPMQQIDAFRLAVGAHESRAKRRLKVLRRRLRVHPLERHHQAERAQRS
jgi:hypothetical protein